MNKTLRLLAVTALAALLAGCVGACCFFEPAYALGPITAEALRADYPVFRQGYGNTPAAAPLAVPAQTEVLVFLGSWCSDSQREVPRYMRIAEASGLATRYIAVDRDKHDPAGLYRRWNIQRVPTFIVLSAGQEAGRIVETPKLSLAEDLNRLIAPPALEAQGPGADNGVLQAAKQ